MSVITAIELVDLRFPTSKSNAGSDAVNESADYSAAYLRLSTHDSAPNLRLSTDDRTHYGCGVTFPIGRGKDICLHRSEWIRRHQGGLA